MRFMKLIFLAFITLSSAQQDQVLVGSFHTVAISTFEVSSAIIFDENLHLRVESTNNGIFSEIRTLATERDPSSIVIEVFHRSIIEIFPNASGIFFQHVRMRRFAQNSFENCGGIFTVDFANNFIQEIPPRVFTNCQNLMLFFLEGNQISTIHRDSFYGLANVELLDLRSNRLTSITAEFFPHLPSLISFWIDDNPIREIPPRTFPTHITSLSLGRCQLSDLQPETFSNLTRLIHLILDGNPIAELRPGIFSDLVNLGMINLNQTNIRRLNINSFGHHPNFTVLHIGSSGLDEIQPGFFAHFESFWYIDSRSNLCADIDILEVRNIDFNVDPAFHQCFANWFVSRETTTTTSTTQSGSEKLNICGFLIAILIGMKIWMI